ncbi:MAG TPA: lamin tail domain-containing protein [Candidatus Saccharimonadales bacterium]|nr:lamin tail domain-containing protein [Candidatus Saccharimonadales bacterium]
MRVMRQLWSVLMVGTTLSLLWCGLVAGDTTMTTSPSLIISQFKITSSNGQFFTLFNTTDSPLNLAAYQLEYFNHYDLAKATTSKLIDLTGTLPPHSYFMVSDDTTRLCYQVTVQSASLGFSSTAGLVEVLALTQTTPGGLVVPQLEDYVGWSKTVTTGAQTLPTSSAGSLLRQPLDSKGMPLLTEPGEGNWQVVQPSSTNPCQLVTAGSTSTLITQSSDLLPATEPSAVVGSLATVAPTGPVFPVGDKGLMMPLITELLPNPSGTGTDATNEFVEIYNPNATTFDLSGFSLQAGLTTHHHYVFPAGTNLPAKHFVAFYSNTTRLALSNTGGQVSLLDPFNKVLSTTAAYSTAKDGQAWARANGQWFWTNQPTPNKSNVVQQLNGKTVVQGAATSQRQSAAKGAAAGAPSAASTVSDAADMSPIHVGTLALVAGLALLYGAYEYRADLANRIQQCKRYLSTRRWPRPTFARWRNHRTD